MYQVKKRNGDLEMFELGKIKSAIKRTFESCNRNYQESIIETLSIKAVANAEKKVSNDILSVEDIQDSVESILMGYGYEDVSKAYILYRKQHEKARNAKDTVLDYKKLIEGYTKAEDWRVKENSTVTYSLGGLILGNSGAVTANYWLSEIYDDEVANAHRNCDFHLHDLSMLSAYCAGWSLKQLIKEGLGGVPGKITSKPAKHLSTLCNQMVNFLGCFTDDTRIVLSNGTTPTIREMLDSGQTEWEVKSYDPNTNSVIDSKMDNLHKTRTVDEYLELEFEDGDVVKCTLDHKFYTYNRGWVEAKDLTEKDDVANLDYNKYIVYKITNKQTGEFYIGSHITTNKNDDYLGSGVNITKQVEKFGKDIFIKQILAETTDEESLRKLEATYINEYKDDPLLLNKVKYVNHGFDEINNYKRFPNELKGILVQKDGEGVYVTKASLQTFLNNGYELADINKVCVKSTIVESPRMLGKKHTDETRQLMKQRLQETSVIRGEHISQGIRKIGPDGMNSAKRTQSRVLENGMTHHQMIMKKQMDNGTNWFIKRNPNYIWFLDNGEEQKITTSSVGCSPKDIRTRIEQIIDFYSDSIVWDVSKESYLRFITIYPDWTGKFNLIGFQHSCRSAIKRNKLDINMIGSVLA